MKYLDNISDEDIVELNIPTGIPLVYELDATLAPIRHYYLGDAEAAARAAEAVAKQGKTARRRRSLDFFFGRLVGRDPQRLEEPPIVGGHVLAAAGELLDADGSLHAPDRRCD